MDWNLVTNISSDIDNGVLWAVTPIDCYENWIILHSPLNKEES